VQRELILVPSANARVIGETPIGPGYARGRTPQEMRGWADGLSRLYRTIEIDRGLPPERRQLEQWRNAPREELSQEARGVVDAHRKFMSDPSEGIQGLLRSDGQIELEKGRHRANYILERPTDPLPVWVSASDERSMQQLRSECSNDLARCRPELLGSERDNKLPEHLSEPETPDRLADRPTDISTAQAREQPVRDRDSSHTERER
jgi:hypothetical protein